MPSDELTNALDRTDQPADTDAPAAPRGITDVLSDAEAWQTRHLADTLIAAGVNPERYIGSCITAMRKSPNILEMGLTTEGRKSIFAAITRCAELGLEVNNDLGHAYLVAFMRNRGQANQRWELQLIIGYKGYLKLAGETGQLKSFDIHEVYTGDDFEITYGTGDDAGLVHRPKLLNDDGTPVGPTDRGTIYCYYGIVKFLDGGYYFTHMTLADIAERKGRSGAVRAGSSTPWDTDEVAMSKKTVARAMVPYMRLGSRVALALADDEKIVTDDGELAFIDTTGS